jgi:hypothetical protein
LRTEDTTEAKSRVLVSNPILTALILPATADTFDVDPYGQIIDHISHSDIQFTFGVGNILFPCGVEGRGKDGKESRGARPHVDTDDDVRAAALCERDMTEDASEETLGDSLRLLTDDILEWLAEDRRGVEETDGVKLFVRCRDEKVGFIKVAPKGPDVERWKDLVEARLSDRLGVSSELETARRA